MAAMTQRENRLYIISHAASENILYGHQILILFIFRNNPNKDIPVFVTYKIFFPLMENLTYSDSQSRIITALNMTFWALVQDMFKSNLT